MLHATVVATAAACQTNSLMARQQIEQKLRHPLWLAFTGCNL